MLKHRQIKLPNVNSTLVQGCVASHRNCNSYLRGFSYLDGQCLPLAANISNRCKMAIEYWLPKVDKSTIPGRRQSKTLRLSTDEDQKSSETDFLDYRLSPIGRQMTIENTVSGDF